MKVAHTGSVGTSVGTRWQPIDLSTPAIRMADSKVSLSVRDLSYGVVNNGRLKRILRSCNVQLFGGELCAVLGPSGSGKTTLLDLVAKRKTVGVWSGEISLQGFLSTQEASIVAYVYQADCLISTLTVQESIRYSAWLNLSSRISDGEKEARVDQVIRQLALDKVKYSKVFDDVKHCGLSGGEKKRLAIAIQIISDPAVVLLDEPTGGLDSALAMEVMSAVRSFCTEHKIVISTIHQPSRGVFALFDKLLVMVQGRVVFFGRAQDAVSYFTSPALGFTFAGGFHNPAEFILDICRAQILPRGSSVRLQPADLAGLYERSGAFAAVLGTLQEAGRGAQTPDSSTLSGNNMASDASASLFTVFSGWGAQHPSPYVRSILSQCRVLMHRTWYSKVRDEADMRSQVVKNITLGLLWGLIFFQKGNPDGPYYNEGYMLAKVQSLSSLLYQLTIFSAYSSLSAVGYIGSTLRLFRREAASHSYSPLAYAVSQTFALLPLQFLLAVLLLFVMYFPAGLPLSGAYFFFMLLTSFVGSFYMFVLATTITAVADLGWTFIFLPVIADISVTLTGYAPQLNDMPAFYTALSNVNFGRWQYESLMINHWSREDTDDGSGYDENGNGDVLDDYGFDGFNKFNCVWIIFAFATTAVCCLCVSLQPAPSQLRKVRNAEEAKEVLATLHPASASQQPSSFFDGFLPAPHVTLSLKEKLVVTDPSQLVVEEPVVVEAPQRLSVQSFAASNVDGELAEGCTLVFSDICAPPAAPLPHQTHHPHHAPAESADNSSVSSLSDDAADSPPPRSAPPAIPTTASSAQFVRDVHSMVLPGEMCAIMGSSGAGKTTLLNILSQRKRASDYSGRIYYNGVLGVMPPFGYVTQEDVHMGVLTVRESLTFAANLRLSEAWSAQEKEKRVQRVLALLLLQHVANNTVGEALSHGISGGELKRLSIGVELLHFPGLMFLDEPTTGLDSSTSMEVLSALRNLANQHRTIVMTLHQPSQDIFQLFDRVLIMAEARVVYFGGVQNCADFYTQSPYKFAFPTTMDPAEFMIAVAGSRLQAADGRVVSAGELAAHYRTTPSCDALRESVRHLIATYAQNTASTPHPSEDPAIAAENAPHLSFRYQLQILLERRILVTRRRWLFFAWKMLREVLLAIFVGTVWFQVGDGSSESVYFNRLSALYKTIVYVTARNMDATAVFEDRRFYYRERGLNAYSAFAHWVSIAAVQVPVHVVFVVVFSCLVYPIVGLRAGGGPFFAYLAFSVVAELVGYFLFTFVASMCSSPFAALHYLPMVQMSLLTTAGFSEYLPNMQVWMKTLTYGNPLRYVFQGMVLNELQDNGNLPESHRYIVMLGFTGISPGGCAAMLLLLLALAMCGHYCALRYMNFERR